MPDNLTADRRFRIHLEWTDLRTERAVPLEQLFQLSSLPLHLRDLVSQMCSRLLVEILLRDTSTAKLYHRSWQHRQRETVPLVNSIATSISSLLPRTSKCAELQLLLQQLQLSESLPSVITLSNLLNELDMTHYSPAGWPLSATRRTRPQRGQCIRADDPDMGFALAEGDDGLEWIDTEAPQIATSSPNDELDKTSSQVSFASDDEEDENRADAAWTELLRLSQVSLPSIAEACIRNVTKEGEPQAESKLVCNDAARPLVADREEEEHDENASSAFFEPEFDRGESEGDADEAEAAWAEIIHSSIEPAEEMLHPMLDEVVEGTGIGSRTDLFADEDAFRSQHGLARAVGIIIN